MEFLEGYDFWYFGKIITLRRTKDGFTTEIILSPGSRVILRVFWGKHLMVTRVKEFSYYQGDLIKFVEKLEDILYTTSSIFGMGSPLRLIPTSIDGVRFKLNPRTCELFYFGILRVSLANEFLAADEILSIGKYAVKEGGIWDL